MDALRTPGSAIFSLNQISKDFVMRQLSMCLWTVVIFEEKTACQYLWYNILIRGTGWKSWKGMFGNQNQYLKILKPWVGFQYIFWRLKTYR